MSHDCSFLSDLDLDGDVSFDDAARESHAADWVAQEAGLGVRPNAVVWPKSTADVSTVLSAASEREVPVTPYAAGTSMEGNAVPLFEGISMDMTKMDAVLDVRPDDFQMDVEPGVMGNVVDERVAEHGMFFPPTTASAERTFRARRPVRRRRCPLRRVRRLSGSRPAERPAPRPSSSCPC